MSRTLGILGNRLRAPARRRRHCRPRRVGAGVGLRSAGRDAVRTARRFDPPLSGSASSSRRPRPTAASRRSNPPLRFSGGLVSTCSPRVCAQFGLGRTRQLVDVRHAAWFHRCCSGAGGMNVLGVGGSPDAGGCSGNRDGFGGMGRIVTSSPLGAPPGQPLPWQRFRWLRRSAPRAGSASLRSPRSAGARCSAGF